MRRSFRYVISALGVLTLSLNAKAQTPSFITDSLDSYIERGMKQWQIPGLSIAIVKDGKVLLSKGYGVRELGKEEKVDENTLFIIASNSKLFDSRVVSTHLVVTFPSAKSACAKTDCMKSILVTTPCTTNSFNAACIF